jgi:hypothetical protein
LVPHKVSFVFVNFNKATLLFTTASLRTSHGGLVLGDRY